MSESSKLNVFVRGVGPWLLLALTAAFLAPIVTPVQANPRFGRPESCFAAIGTNPQGKVYMVYFYRHWMAADMAAAWIASGWTDVIVVTC